MKDFRLAYILVLSLFLALFFASCGPEPDTERSGQLERRVGASRALDSSDVLSAEEARTIQTLCVDLNAKEDVFRNFASMGTKLVYTSSRRSCGQTEETTQNPFNVTIRDQGAVLTYVSAAQLPFTSVVTNNNDVMGDVCDHVRSALEAQARPTRVMLSGGNPKWIFAFSEGDARCEAEQDANCLYVESGIRESSGRYRIRDVKYFAVNGDLGDPKRGFVFERRQVMLCFNEEGTTAQSMSFVRVEN